ncbi:C-C chemokine receptor type 4-like [Eublepharis macularius]|uniref:C-C chemokine receptor type 4-like n=1 Tax=Eublepharis macularius TaxID=481883 RepID=A0AA97K358_EUBMA|nr:C-C chemokine receptor type 4-like [Eublepharis macularius]
MVALDETPSTVVTTYFSSYDENYDDGPGICEKDEVNDFGSWFLPTCYLLVFLLGLAGNVLVILVLLKYKRLRSMTDIYLLNLAISDLFFVFALPFESYFEADEWVFGTRLCKFFSWVYLTGFYSGIFFIMLMSIDRYLAVVHVVFALKARTVSYGTLTSLVVWLVAMTASIPGLVFSESVSENNRFTCRPSYPKNDLKWKLFIPLEFNILGLLVPFTVMLFCYTKILKTLWHCRNENKKKAVKMIFVVMIIFLLFWTPYNIVLFLQCLHDTGIFEGCRISTILDYAIQATQTLSFFHCCLNPVIYFFMGQKFKKYIRLLFKNNIFYRTFCKPCGLPDTFHSELTVSSRTQSTSDEEAL